MNPVNYRLTLPAQESEICSAKPAPSGQSASAKTGPMDRSATTGGITLLFD